ncbi:auxin efflux carrier [Salipaludibacillus neizhouensis]|uniref:Auxin efflux carrier n=1 Tax=Salipaludibacillus neizhouensis TaxID=885475 RepID=A0A3A9K6N1_9BACI|nr:AEC family transporter [Salipaludibacillus neizhouensis]RKL68227.1 auxin efflux carrier [Salipaludibacillus neizhouensis]
MDITVVITSIAVMGIMIALGVFFAFKVVVTAEIKQTLILIVLNIAVPSVILNGVFNTEVSDKLLNQAIIIFGISIIFHLGALLLAWVFTKIFRFESVFAKKMTILAALGNTGFIGIPLCATIFGPVGGLLAAIFDAGLDIILFSVVIYMLQSGRGLNIRQQLKSLVNIPLLAVIIGLTSAFIGFQPPEIIKQLTALLSGLAAPLAMLYLGILVQGLFAKTRFTIYPQIWFPLGIRLIIIPILALLLISLTNLEDLIIHIVIILSAMPTFTLAAILFSRYTGDEETAVMTIAFSTIFSLLTIPLISYLSVHWLS